MNEAAETKPSTSLPGLLQTTASLALGLALLSLASPFIAVPRGVAQLIGEALAMTALLVTAWSAPAKGARQLHWFLGLAALEALLFAVDIGPMMPALLCLTTFVLLTAAGLVGGYIGGMLEYPGMLMVVSYVAALADCYSVLHPDGLTAQVLKHPKALALLTVSVPLLGSDAILPVVGIGDVAFVSLYVAGARATGLAPRRTLIALGVAMCAVAFSVEHLGMPLPALPFLGGAVLLAHPEAVRLPPTQTRRIAANLAVVTLVLGGLLWAGVRGAPHEAPPISPASRLRPTAR